MDVPRLHAGYSCDTSNVDDAAAKGGTIGSLSFQKFMTGCRQGKHGEKIGLPDKFNILHGIINRCLTNAVVHAQQEKGK